MADKAISELISANQVTPTDLFVLEQYGTAKKLTGQVLENWLVSFADGHGGIQSIQKVSTNGLSDTYRITLADTTVFDFAVTNGRGITGIAKTSTSGLADTYTISYNNGATDTFTVTNGAKGDKGDNAYVWIKYASQQPTDESHSMGDIPDDWIGIYSGNAASAPSDWKQYQWFNIKGPAGDNTAALEAARLANEAAASAQEVVDTVMPDVMKLKADLYGKTRNLYDSTNYTLSDYAIVEFKNNAERTVTVRTGHGVQSSVQFIIPTPVVAGKKIQVSAHVTPEVTDTDNFFRIYIDGVRSASVTITEEGDYSLACFVPEDAINVEVFCYCNAKNTGATYDKLYITTQIHSEYIQPYTAVDYVAREIQNSRSINEISLNDLNGSGISKTENDDGSITFENTVLKAYHALSIPLENVNSGDRYLMKIKIASLSFTDYEAGTNPTVSFRFRGKCSGATTYADGIKDITQAGEYAVIVVASGFEKSLDLLLTSSKTYKTSVTISGIMLAKTDLNAEYMNSGDTVSDNVARSLVYGHIYNNKSWGVSNVIAKSNQMLNISFTPVENLPSQFTIDGNKYFKAGKEFMGFPYSSARAVDKLCPFNISVHTFMTALKNPRSVLYKRKLTYSNAGTYYGMVCSSFVGYTMGWKINRSCSELIADSNLVQHPPTGIRVGDMLINGSHIILITDVCRDKHGRIISITTAEAGTPVVYQSTYLWNAFVEKLVANGYVVYRNPEIDDVQYEQIAYAKGYDDEILTQIVYPDIMCEYGDRAVLLNGEHVTINVINSTGYSEITVKKDGAVLDRRTDMNDFTLEGLQAGAYVLEMTGLTKTSSSTFTVVGAACSYDASAKTVRFSSSNATPFVVYAFTGKTDEKPIAMHPIILTAEDIEAGYKDISDSMIGDYRFVKVAFITDDGTATWYCDEWVRACESNPVWESVN